MLKRLYLIALIPVLAACTQVSNQNGNNNNIAKSDTVTSVSVLPEQLIVPGKSIGKLSIDQDADKAISDLGKPDSSDAAMGSALITWFANHDPSGNRTTIFTRRNMGGADERVARVKRILITSPDFKTAEGVATGSTYMAITEHYSLKEVHAYTKGNSHIKVLTDYARGISFDIDSSNTVCVAITVYQPGDNAGSYIDMH
ncbi:MAG: hypothetical protein EOP46_19390 [Sphingobacteriaceae bacterium]|nr:MAG: hypothetical protein EOP46_19390 [Sphingobacteriaceae bacterium]